MNTPSRKEILNALILAKEQDIEQTEMDLHNWQEASDIDEDDVIESEDLSHQTEATERRQGIKTRLDQKKTELKHLSILEDGPAVDYVTPNSVVVTPKRLFYIGMTSTPIQLDSYQLQGVSLNAPLTQKMLGLKKGDTFEFNDELIPVDSIL